MGWKSLRQARGPRRVAFASENLRCEGDVIARTGTGAMSAARQRAAPDATIRFRVFAGIRTGEHRHLTFEAGQYDFRRVMLLPALIGPLAGLQLALDVDLDAFGQEALGNVGDRLVEDDD